MRRTNKISRSSKLAAGVLLMVASAFPAFALNLPGGSYTPQVTFDASFGLGAYFNVVFGTPAIPSGFDVVQGVKYLGWCAAQNEDLGNVNPTGKTTLTPSMPYMLYNTSPTASLPPNAMSPNWGAVNWLLNNKGGNSVVDIQEAIWFLLDGSYHTNFFISSAPSPAAAALVATALTHNTFVPLPGQIEAVLLDAGQGLHGTGSPQDIIIEVPIPVACTITGATISNTSWNKFNVPAGTSPVVWIHAHIGTPSNITGSTSVLFTNVVFSLNGINYPLPDGLLTFSSAAPSTITTTFDSGANRWETLINPNDLSDEIFFTGAAIPVNANIAGGGKATLTYNVNTSDKLFAFSWQWSAAVFTFWPGNNAAMIQPFHQSLHAGTPLNLQVQKSLIQGPRGGGGSNFTGSWSATGTAACQVK